MGFWRQALEWTLLLLRVLEFLLGVAGTSIRFAHSTLMEALGLGADIVSGGSNEYWFYSPSAILLVATVLTLSYECV